MWFCCPWQYTFMYPFYPKPYQSTYWIYPWHCHWPHCLHWEWWVNKTQLFHLRTLNPPFSFISLLLFHALIFVFYFMGICLFCRFSILMHSYSLHHHGCMRSTSSHYTSTPALDLIKPSWNEKWSSAHQKMQTTWSCWCISFHFFLHCELIIILQMCIT